MFTAKDDLFHEPATSEHFLTETNWWNFCIPERNLDGQLYIYFRPNLGTTYAGVYVWDDFCRHFSDALYFDTWLYLPMPKADPDGYRLENGIHVKVLEPLRKYQLTYEPPNGTSFHLVFEGLTDALDYNEGRSLDEKDVLIQNHMEQVGRMTGDLTLYGEHLRVDCITHRDHSWNAVRREERHFLPNFGWQAGHFGEELCFQLWFWYGEPVMTDLVVGFVYENRQPQRIVWARRETQWDETGVEPRTMHIEFRDANGQVYRINGRALNMFPWTAHLNWVCYAGLVEWDLDGRIGYGDVQDGRDLDWVRRKKLDVRKQTRMR